MKFTLSNVLGGAFSNVRKGFLPLLLVTLILYLVPNQLLMIGFRVEMGFTIGAVDSWHGNGLFISIGVWLVLYFLTFAHISAVTEVAVLTSASKPVKLGEVLTHSIGNALPIFFIYLLCTLGWMIGGVLLLIPAFIFGTIFSVVVPAYVSEKPGVFGAFGRSRALTKGHRWGIFGIWFLIVIVFYILMAAIEVPILMPMLRQAMNAKNGTPDPSAFMPSIPVMLALAVAFSAIWVVLLTINASFYTTLRGEKEQFNPANVQKVFE